MTTSIDPLVLPAKAFGKAWRWCFNAASTDAKDFTLYRSLFVEVFNETGVRIVATNRYVMLRSWVSVVDLDGDPIYNQPGLDEAPDTVLYVRDQDLRAKALATFMASKDNDEDGLKAQVVAISIGRIEDDVQPMLGDELAREGLLLAYGDERLCVPLMEGLVPYDWRRMYGSFETAEVEEMTFGVELLAILGRLTGASPHVRFATSGPDHPILFVLPNSAPPLDGLLAPVRRSYTAADEEETTPTIPAGATVVPWDNDEPED